ncbi:MAG: ABC transporter ATP-binding protein [Candidatus Omnitrophica bacterium]|nr:ABC transporter ATP-binding protein [Candidatus Omnitrophota bacterium]
MNSISIQNLIKTYAGGTEALKGVNLEVASGDFCALLGANGAGKTTIIGILTGLVNKTSGSVRIFDYDIDQHHSKAKRVIGVVPQEMNFNIFERVEDIVVNQAGYFGIDRTTAFAEAEKNLKQLRLWDRRHEIARNLSGGMKRRLMIARALVNKPKLLILDEPTAGVDVELRHSMWEFLGELNGQGVTILLTTHYLEEVEQLCRQAAIIKDGQIIANDRVKNLVKLVAKETYIVHVDEICSLEKIRGYNPVVIDENTFEVELSKEERLNEFIAYLSQLGMMVTDFRPKGNRIEKLFLNILNSKTEAEIVA